MAKDRVGLIIFGLAQIGVADERPLGSAHAVGQLEAVALVALGAAVQVGLAVDKGWLQHLTGCQLPFVGEVEGVDLAVAIQLGCIVCLVILIVLLAAALLIHLDVAGGQAAIEVATPDAVPGEAHPF